MQEVFAFDVDGTLTPPRQPIVEEFARFLVEFATKYPIYLISGSDLGKLREQLPQELFVNSAGVFTCSASEFWCHGRLIYRRQHKFTPKLMNRLNEFVKASPYPSKLGNHVEERPGMLNVSVVGRNADEMARKVYNSWDTRFGERLALVEEISSQFPTYEASAGGAISVDIVPKGWNKAVALPEIIRRHNDMALTFFGDKMDEAGNDRPLADALVCSPHHRAIAVDGFRDTWRHLCHLPHALEAA